MIANLITIIDMITTYIVNARQQLSMCQPMQDLQNILMQHTSTGQPL